MNKLEPIYQTDLFGLEKYIKELISLYEEGKYPNKILFSGLKGIGKSTLAYHFINYVLSQGETYSYDKKNFKIDSRSQIFKTVVNKSNPNLNIIDITNEKKSIDINQIRELTLQLNKSSFNNKPRFVLIDNIEFLNVNSINALLKILEEPTQNTYFLLIHNNKKILPTLKSRCLDFKISLSHEKSINICNKLVGSNISDLICSDILDYYFTPGKIYNLIKFAKENSLDLKNLNLESFLSYIIDNSFYKKDSSIKYMVYDFFELYLINKSSMKNFGYLSYFLKQLKNCKQYNLDEESLFLEFKYKQLNG